LVMCRSRAACCGDANPIDPDGGTLHQLPSRGKE
jgi:hypothetical protein